LDFGANLLKSQARNTTTKHPDVAPFLDQIARESTPGLTTTIALDNASIHHNIDHESSTGAVLSAALQSRTQSHRDLLKAPQVPLTLLRHLD
jgi:hypothetical protein